MIVKGEDWGQRARVPAGAVRCPDDRSAAAVVATARARREALPPVLITGGDLHRTLGGRGDSAIGPGDEATRVECDVGEVLLDGTIHWFVAHLVIGGPWWARDTIVVANAAHVGKANVAPRAHPGDGRLDIVETSMGLRQRLLSVPRLRSGTHIPHPDITSSRAVRRQFSFEGPARQIRLDGRRMGGIRDAVVRVRPAALEVYVA